MLEWLAQVDSRLFHSLNSGLANPVSDVIMPVITNDWVLRILAIAAAIWLLVTSVKRFWPIVLTAILLVIGADAISSRVLKPLFNRPRPCVTEENVHLLVGCGGGKSLPSSHAVNAFALASFFALIFPSRKWWLLGIAVIVAFSRIAVGVHYPGDVIAGAIVGSVMAGIALMILSRISPQILVESAGERPRSKRRTKKIPGGPTRPAGNSNSELRSTNAGSQPPAG